MDGIPRRSSFKCCQFFPKFHPNGKASLLLGKPDYRPEHKLFSITMFSLLKNQQHAHKRQLNDQKNGNLGGEDHGILYQQTKAEHSKVTIHNHKRKESSGLGIFLTIQSTTQSPLVFVNQNLLKDTVIFTYLVGVIKITLKIATFAPNRDRFTGYLPFIPQHHQ